MECWWSELIHADRIRRIATIEFKAKTSIGADGIGFREIAQAPPDALHDLSLLIHQILWWLAWPTQCHMNLISLLGKKD